MNFTESFVLVNNLKLPVTAPVSEVLSAARRVIKRAGLISFAKDYSIYRRSVDARHKPDIFFAYSVAVTGDFPEIDGTVQNKYGISLQRPLARPQAIIGGEELSAPPVIVGSGPCGLFAALLLAENGYNPIILERGGSISERHSAVDNFNTRHILDTETNIQFGAGGAGTFSDGKLVTRINDPLTNYIFERFVEFGAPEEIRYIAKPHIGTDVLSRVVDRMLDRIVELGGKILYHTKYISYKANNGRVYSVVTSNGEINAGALILAVGHSARDTYEGMLKQEFSIEAKSFSVGMRIEHLAEDIDRAMYGDPSLSEKIGHAEYALSCNTKTRGSYTFCMCPGGVVVAAASEEGGVVVNGMSYNSRSETNSNSAVLTSVFKEDYGGTPMAAIEFQRRIERAAFKAGGGDYCAPIITVGDLLADQCKTMPSRILPSYMSGKNVNLASPDSYLPDFVCQGLKSAIVNFDKKINGFAAPDAVLTGAETRTSAPLRVLRNSDTRLAIGFKNIYPAGEGAGYAGGITSAAVDGAKSALALMEAWHTR